MESDLARVTRELLELNVAITKELGNFQARGAKASAQRIRVATVKQAKLAKEFRRLSV